MSHKADYCPIDHRDICACGVILTGFAIVYIDDFGDACCSEACAAPEWLGAEAWTRPMEERQ